MKPTSRGREKVEYQVHTRFRRGIIRPVPGLVVERPKLSGVHHDGLVTSGKRASLRTLQDQMKAVSNSIVGASIDVRENPALR